MNKKPRGFKFLGGRKVLRRCVFGAARAAHDRAQVDRAEKWAADAQRTAEQAQRDRGRLSEEEERKRSSVCDARDWDRDPISLSHFKSSARRSSPLVRRVSFTHRKSGEESKFCDLFLPVTHLCDVKVIRYYRWHRRTSEIYLLIHWLLLFLSVAAAQCLVKRL